MKKIVTVLALVFCFNLIAQKNYLITNAGEKVPITGNADLGTQYISFHKGKKEITYYHKEVKYVQVGNRKFITLPIKGGETVCLQEIVCYNDQYILTSYPQLGYCNLIVFDWNLNIVMPYTYLPGKKNKQKEVFDTNINQYFKDSPIIMDAFNKNMKKEYPLLEDICSVNGGTKDISTLIQAFLSGETNNGKAK